MIPDLLEKIFHAWRNLSERERRLAMLTAAALVVMVLFFVFHRAQGRVAELDREIDRLEEELVSATRLIGHREMIESQYNAIAAQHSSKWTEAEIHDRLRQEIYRLAKNDPPPLDANGIPVAAGADSGNLVEISLGKGQMSEGGKGYREYRINLRVSPTYLQNIVQLLERLHNSPQSLRIDALDLNRSPESEIVAASIDISRIVADGATATPAAVAAPVVSGAGRVPLRADAWQATDATVEDAEDAAQSAHGAVTIRMMAAGAEVYLPQSLPGGMEYEVIADIASSSQDIKIGVALDADGTVLTPVARPSGEEGEQRYQTTFTLPGTGAPVAIRCPWIQADSPGATVRVSAILLRAVSEMYK